MSGPIVFTSFILHSFNDCYNAFITFPHQLQGRCVWINPSQKSEEDEDDEEEEEEEGEEQQEERGPALLTLISEDEGIHHGIWSFL